MYILSLWLPIGVFGVLMASFGPTSGSLCFLRDDFGAPFAPLGFLWGPFGRVFLAPLFASLGATLAPFGLPLGSFGAPLDSLWTRFELPWAPFGLPWPPFGSLWTMF